MITATVDDSSPVPPFEQLRSQLADAVRAGFLAPGVRLPTVRQLAGDLGIAPNTVARAYKALEEENLVRAQGRRGTVVTDVGALADERRHALLTDAASRYLAEAKRLGVSSRLAVKAIQRAAVTGSR